MSRRGKLATLIAMLITAGVLLFLAGCVSVPYDQTVAAGLAGLQSSYSRFFDQLGQVAGTPDAAWAHQAEWYAETRVEIAALRARAAAHGPTNDATVQALDLLLTSVNELADAHSQGLSAAEIPVLRTLFDSQLRMLLQLETARKRTPVAEVLP